jgi:solute carrier family 35 protein E1
MLLSTVLYRVSLLYNSLSFAQAVKTLQPLFATLLSAVFLRERSSTRRVVSLLLLLLGVAIATTTEVSFSAIGFVCTLGSCFAQALQSVLSKSLLVHNRISEEHLFACAAIYTTLMLTPLWLVADASSLVAGEPPQLIGSGALWLLLLNGVSNFVTQALSFSVLCVVVSPVSAAVVSTFKRVVIIGAAVVWFRTPITVPHAAGIALALLAVALFQEKDARSPEEASPRCGACAQPHASEPPHLTRPAPTARQCAPAARADANCRVLRLRSVRHLYSFEELPLSLAAHPRRRDSQRERTALHAHRHVSCRAV